MKEFNELEFPQGVIDAEVSFEMLRFWIADQEDAVVLRVGTNREDEPAMWGSILADISRHCVRAICAEWPELNPDEVRARMERSYIDRLSDLDGTSGSLLGREQ
jgi:Domain of unknown function (DUF5076)